MQDINISFSREELKRTLADVKSAFPELKVKDAWVWHAGRGHWEFHFNEFYWHGRADNAYEARSNGWAAYLSKKGVGDYAVDGLATVEVKA